MEPKGFAYGLCLRLCLWPLPKALPMAGQEYP